MPNLYVGDDTGQEQFFPPPPPPPTPPSGPYPIGPTSSKSYYHAPPAPAPPPTPDLWANITSAVHSAAAQLVDKFEALVGGAPANFDSATAALALAKSGVNLTTSATPMDAFQWLYDNLPNNKQAENPGAQFGMDKDLYNVTVQKMDSAYFDWTGNQLSSQGVNEGSGLWQAIRGNWLPDQVRNFAIYGNATGSGPMLDVAKFSGDMPWLSQGQTYSQTLQQFQALEETTPTDKATLAAFWRFGQSAKQIGSGAGAVETAPRQPLFGGTAVR